MTNPPYTRFDNSSSENTGTATSPDPHDPSHTNARANQTWVVTMTKANQANTTRAQGV